jgi:hypothetical protein
MWTANIGAGTLFVTAGLTALLLVLATNQIQVVTDSIFTFLSVSFSIFGNLLNNAYSLFHMAVWGVAFA